MALLVDRLREYAHRPFGQVEWCHLASDVSFDELHAFAERLGIPRRGFQGDHYDLPRRLRDLAVSLGAEEVASKDLVRRMVGRRTRSSQL